MTDRADERVGVAPRVLLGGASDARLVALARAGDEQAFAAIFERYRAPLLRYCRGFLPPAAAEDALQQTFVNAYAALCGEGARAPESLRPWLYRVAHNAALNVARDPQAGLEPLPDGLDGGERPHEVVQRRERLRRVVGAVTALPPKQRQVIVRHALDGDSHERIATDLGVSPGSVRQLAHRARRTVRDAAAAVLPAPLLRLLPWGANVAEAPLTGGGAALAKVAVTAVVMGAAGGGAVEVADHGRDRPEREVVTVAQAPPAGASSSAPAGRGAPGVVRGQTQRQAGREGSSGRGSSGHRSSGGGSSRSGSSGSGSSGTGSSGSGSSGSGSSGSGSSDGGSSGGGSSGSGSSGAGSSGSGSSGDGSVGGGSSGSGSSGSGSSGSGSSGSGSSGSGSSGTTFAATPAPTPESSGSGSSGSGSSGSGSGDD